MLHTSIPFCTTHHICLLDKQLIPTSSWYLYTRHYMVHIPQSHDVHKLSMTWDGHACCSTPIITHLAPHDRCNMYIWSCMGLTKNGFRSSNECYPMHIPWLVALNLRKNSVCNAKNKNVVNLLICVKQRRHWISMDKWNIYAELKINKSRIMEILELERGHNGKVVDFLLGSI